MDQGPYSQQPGPPSGPPYGPPEGGSPPPLGGPPPGPVPPPGAGAPPPVGPPPSSGGPAAWLIPLAAGVIVVAVAALAWLLVFDGDDDGDTATSDDAGESGVETSSEGEEGGDEEGGDEEDLTYDPARLTGTWEGTYECAYGEAALTLTVDDFPGEDAVGAHWAFSPVDDSSEAPEGVFHLEGTYADDELLLEGYEWDEEHAVDDVDLHGLEADLSDRDDTEVITGTVVGDGCGEITLERTNTDPWYVGSFTGQYGCNQGVTGADLSLEATGTDRVEGLFEFYDVGETREGYDPVDYGSYNVVGTYQDRELVLIEAGWVDGPPEGYAAVDLHSFVEAPVDPATFVGIFPSEPGCTVLGLDRVDDESTGDEGSSEESDEESGEGTEAA